MERLLLDRRANLLFLMETKTSVVNVSLLLRNKGFSDSTGVDVDGLRGSLWVGWKSNLSVSILFRSNHLILLSIKDDFNLFGIWLLFMDRPIWRSKRWSGTPSMLR